MRTIGEDPGPGLAALTRFVQRRDELPTSRHLVVDLDYLFGARASEKAASHIGQQAFPVEVFQHELAHLALLRLQFPTIPGWVAEGAAMFLSGERRLAEWQAGLTSGEFERISFSRLGGEFNLDTEIEYAYANAAVTNLVEAFGVDKFWAFYRGFKRRGDTADVVLRLTYGFDEAELDRRTREWIRRAVAAG